MHIVWLLSLCCFTMGCSGQFIMGIPGVISESLNVGLTEVGQLMTAFGVTSAFATPVMLVATARLTQRQQMVLGLAIMSVGLATMALSSTYAVLFASRVVMGLGSGVFTSTALAICTKLAKPGHEASAMANVSLGFSASQVFAMPIARLAAPYMDWHVLYGILTGVALVAIVAIWRCVPSTPPAMAGAGLRERLSPLGDRRVVMAMLTVYLLATGYASFYTYVTPFLEEVFGAASPMVSTVLLLAGLMSIVGSKGSGMLADRVGFKKTILTAVILQIVTLTCVGATAAAGLGAALVLCMCVYAAADWGFVPAQNLLFTKMLPTTASLAIALSSSALQLGYASGAALGGAILLGAPLGVLPFVAAAFALAALGTESYVLRAARRAIEGRAAEPERQAA